MDDLVNLSKFRKAKQRQAGEDQAAINREKFGRSKAKAIQDRRSRERQDKVLDGHRLESALGKDHDADKPKR